MERLIAMLLLAWAAVPAHAQLAEDAIRQGNAAYEKGDNAAAVEQYSKARNDERGMFNLGNAHYRMDSVADAQRMYENAASMATTPEAQARAYYNLGNTWLKQRNFKEAAQAFKEALKRTPHDEDSRYNLAYAQKMLAQQEQQQGQGGDQDKQDKQDKQDQQGKDQENQDQQQDQKGNDKQESDQDQQEGGDQDPHDQDQGEDERQQRQARPGDLIDPQDAARMLDAAQQQEQDVQDKVRRMMQPAPAKPIEKDW